MDYKKYSLEQLENWVHDCITSGDASPHEIYSTIRKAVQEDYEIHKDISQRCFGLLELMSGHRPVDLNSDWEQYYYPEEYSNATQYTDEELDAMCTAAEKQQKELSIDGKTLSYSEAIAAGWKMTDDGFWYKDANSVQKWTLPVEVDGASGEYYLQLPDDLLDKLNWKENDTLEYSDNGDGSFSLRKVTKPLIMDEC